MRGSWGGNLGSLSRRGGWGERGFLELADWGWVRGCWRGKRGGAVRGGFGSGRLDFAEQSI